MGDGGRGVGGGFFVISSYKLQHKKEKQEKFTCGAYEPTKDVSIHTNKLDCVF